MLAVFVLFLQDNFGWSAALTGSYYSTFLMFVYFLPFIGGILADKFGYGRMVTIGISIMFLGYLLLSFPLGNGTMAMIAIIGALALICMGTGLFKGNLQVMVGDLYKSPELSGKRDAAFSIFYMAINIGALFAPECSCEDHGVRARHRFLESRQLSLRFRRGLRLVGHLDDHLFRFAFHLPPR